jgi:hypothetical protein
MSLQAIARQSVNEREGFASPFTTGATIQLHCYECRKIASSFTHTALLISHNVNE